MREGFISLAIQASVKQSVHTGPGTVQVKNRKDKLTKHQVLHIILTTHVDG